MAEILQAPAKTVMLCIVLALEIPAAIILIVGWIKARKEYKHSPDGDAHKN